MNSADKCMDVYMGVGRGKGGIRPPLGVKFDIFVLNL